MSDAAPWVLRINPLPGTTLADAELQGFAEQLIESEQALTRATAVAAATLHATIATVPSGDQRQQLIALRRKVLARRQLALTRPELRDWQSEQERNNALREKVSQAFAGALERERSHLAQVLGNPALGGSLALVAPEVFQQAERYRAAYGGAQASAKARKSARKAERGLVQYVTRALVRTSPLSRFTAVGFATPDPAGLPPQQVDCAGAVAFPGLDRVLLRYVLGGLSSAPMTDAWVGLAPTSALDREAGFLFVLRPSSAGFHRSAVRLVGPALALVDAVAMGPRPVAEVAQVLAAEAQNLVQAMAVVERAVAAGILCTYDRAEDCAVSVPELLRASSSDGSQPSAQTVALLTQASSALQELPQAPAIERAEVLRQIAQPLARLSLSAGRPAQVSVDEDFVLPPRWVNDADWSRQFDDLAAVVELLSVFDWLHDVRIMTKAAVVEQFGVGANISLAQEAEGIVAQVAQRAVIAGTIAHREQLDPAQLTRIAGSDPDLAQLYQVRRRILAWVCAEVDRAITAGEQQLSWSAEHIRSLLADLPAGVRRDPLTYGVLTQWHGQNLIFNDGLPGHGMLYSRFLAADGQLGGTSADTLRKRLEARYAEPGRRVVEDWGLHRLNVNAHPRILAQGLLAKDWYDLRLQHCPDRDALQILDAAGQPIRVLALGTGHPALFPAPLSVASGLTTAGRLNNPLLDNWHAVTAGSSTNTHWVPQLTVGQVILARRRWYGGADFAAALAAGPLEVDRYLALTAWRAEHGVPAEVMIKTAFDDDSPRTLTSAEVLPRRKRHKPQYCDFSSALGVRVLPKMLERRSDDHALSYLEEALPAVRPGRSAAEWIIEFARPGGGQFSYQGRS